MRIKLMQNSCWNVNDFYEYAEYSVLQYMRVSIWPFQIHLGAKWQNTKRSQLNW